MLLLRQFTGFRSLLIIIVVIHIAFGYQTVYVEDQCESDETVVINFGSASANSSGILQLTRNGTFLANRNCTIVLQPPLGFGLVLSIRMLDFRPYNLPNCRNYIEVFDKEKPVRLCGYSDDITEYQAYSTESSALRLKLFTEGSTSQTRSDFTLVATSFLKATSSDCELKLFYCRNSRCIWEGLRCDGHNNCGDQSDEAVGWSANCGSLSTGAIAGIVCGSVSFAILLVVIPIVCCRCRRKRLANENAPPLIDTTSGTNYDSMAQGNTQEYPEGTTCNYSGVATGGSGNTSDSNQTEDYRGYRDMPPAYKP